MFNNFLDISSTNSILILKRQFMNCLFENFQCILAFNIFVYAISSKWFLSRTLELMAGTNRRVIVMRS